MNPVKAIRELYSENQRESDGAYVIKFDDMDTARRFAVGIRNQFVEARVVIDEHDAHKAVEQRNLSVIIQLDMVSDHVLTDDRVEITTR